MNRIFIRIENTSIGLVLMARCIQHLDRNRVIHRFEKRQHHKQIKKIVLNKNF